MLTKLQVINDALSAVGLAHVGSEDSQHPAFLKAKSALEHVLEEVQLTGWWFNRSWRVLMRNGDGEVIIPQYAVIVENTAYPNYVIRGNRLYDRDTGSYAIDGDHEYRIVEALPFEALPAPARAFVSARTKFKHFVDEDGTEPKLSIYGREVAIAEALFKAEHLRHEDLNYFAGEAGKTKYPYAKVIKTR